MAGPETALATGRPDLGQLGPITEPAAAPVSATPSSAEIAQGQQRASAYSLDPNYRPSRGQSQRDPIQLKQGQWLGNGQMARGQASGGDPLFAATMAVPTFEVDQQISKVRKQKAELSDWIAKQGEQFKGKAADPYQPAYEQYVGGEQGKFIKDVADTYFEGDVNKAWKGVYDDPELRAQFDRNNRYLAAIGQANKGGFDTYVNIDEAVKNGEMEISPDTQTLLDDAIAGKWSFDESSPAHSAWKFDQLNEKLSVEKMFNEYYKPLVKDAGDQTVGGNRVETHGNRKFLVTDSKEEYDQFIDQFVKKAKKEGQWRNEDELRAYAEGMVGRMEKETWKELRAPKSGGSSQANQPKTVVGEVEVGLSANYPDNTPTKNPTPVYRVPIARLVDGRSELMAKKDFRDGTGASIKMIPTHLALSDLDGKLYIEGMGEAEKGANKDSDSEGDGATTTNKVPYIGNEKTFELFVGAEQAESAKAKAMQARNSDPMRKRKESKPFVDQTKPLSYDKVKSKLPPGATQADFDEAMKTPEGRAYIESLK